MKSIKEAEDAVRHLSWIVAMGLHETYHIYRGGTYKSTLNGRKWAPALGK